MSEAREPGDARRKEIIRLMREDFDPRPSLFRGEWDDNAEEVADKIEVIIASAITSERALVAELVEALKGLYNNINEFGAVTDYEYMDAARAALTRAGVIHE